MEPVATGAAIAASLMWARDLQQRRRLHDSPKRTDVSIASECIAGGAANAFTSALLNPMDVIKTRMQVSMFLFNQALNE